MTTDPKLIERIARVICRGGGYGQCVGFCHAQRCPSAIDLYGQTATAILPIVAAAINEAVQNERAGVVAMLRNLPKPIEDAMWEACEDYFISDRTTADGMKLALSAIADEVARSAHLRSLETVEHLPPPPAIEAKESQHG